MTKVDIAEKENKMKEIILTQDKVALVDDEDYEYVMQWNLLALIIFFSFWYSEEII